jgi:hypothetical protein
MIAARRAIAHDAMLHLLARPKQYPLTEAERGKPHQPTTSDSRGLIESVLVNLAAVRQSMDQLAAEFVASQQHMASDIAELKAAEQEISDKISSAPSAQPNAAPVQPAPTSARKPAPAPVPLRSRQEAPVR